MEHYERTRTMPETCPLCGRSLLYEEGSSGFSYAFCDEHKIIGDVTDDGVEFEPWVKQELRRKMVAEYEAEHGEITQDEMDRLFPEESS